MKKLLLSLCAILSFNMNASIVVLDWNKVRPTIVAMFPNEDPAIKANKDVAEWAKKANLFLVLWNECNMPIIAYHQMDATQMFLDWLNKKYACTNCLLHCQNHMGAK